MIRFFQTPQKSVIATDIDHALSEQEIKELTWLYGEATLLDAEQLDGFFIGPRREMVTPWSTNAVERPQPGHLHDQHQAGAHQACGKSGGIQRAGRTGPES